MSPDPAMPETLCLFGAGRHGRVLAAQLARRFGTLVVFGDGSRPKGSMVDGCEVRFSGPAECGDYPLLVTVGDNAARRRISDEAKSADIRLAVAVIDRENCFAPLPGPGSQILAGAVLNCGAVVGSGVIVNSNAVVEHDATIGDFCHIAPGSVVGGGARLGEGVFLGTGAVVLPGVSVAAWTVVGAGATVTRPITEAGTYVGVPARLLPRSLRGGQA